MKFVTYVISDPKTGVARYVGKGYEKRPFAHLNKSSNPQLHNLIQKRKREGFQISPFIKTTPSY